MNNKFRLSLLVFLLVGFQNAYAQPCSCSELLNGLIEKVESNYAGYIHKVVEAKDNSSYEKHLTSLKEIAPGVSFEDCYKVLTDYVHWFGDGHLFIFESPRLSPEKSDSIATTVPTHKIPDNFKENISSKSNRDPIEGIWKDADQTIAIVQVQKNLFYGVIQATSSEKWKPDMVKLVITRKNENQYDITIRRNDFAPVRFRNVHIYKNVMLPFGVYRFAKIFPSHTELNYIHPDDPQLPVFHSLNDHTALISVPSALIARNYLDSLIEAHDKEIKSKENLIIDIRGNGGGNYIWRKLLGLTYTVAYPKQKEEGEEDFLILASPDNANYVDKAMTAYFRQISDSSGIAFYDKLINKLNSQTGNFIPFSFYNPSPDTARRELFEYPKQIAIITDRGVASAAEAFILSARENSDKITLYGANTHGMIDYMNTTVVWLGCPDHQHYLLGYPTFFSEEIKSNPVNPTGIVPDLYIPREEKDWIMWVLEDLER